MENVQQMSGAVWNSRKTLARETGTRGTGNWIVAALVLVPGLSTLRLPLGGGDEAALLVYPEKLAQGALIHRDFFSVYGPGTYRLLQLAYSPFGASLTIERLIGVSYHVAIALGVMALASRLGRHASLLAGLVSAATLAWFVPYAYAWMGGLALTIWSLSFAARTHNPRRTAVLAGLLGGLVPYWRPEMAVLDLAALPLLWRTGRLKPYCLGLLFGTLPLLHHVSAAGNQLFDNVFMSRVAVNAQTRLSTVDPHVWAILALCLCCICLFLYLAVRRPRHRRLMLSATIASLGMFPQALQRIDIFHTIFIACFILPLGAAAFTGSSKLSGQVSGPRR